MLLGMGRYDEAKERSFKTINEWENSDQPFAPNLVYTAYSNLAYIDLYNCTVSHKYDFTEYLRKSIEYLKRSTMPPLEVAGPYAVPDIRSLACVVGEDAQLQEFDLFLEKSRQSAEYISESSHNMYFGYEDLVACELAFFKNQPIVAKNYARQAINKAREKMQYSIGATATQYLLRIAAQEGNYSLAREMLRQLRAHLDNPDFWNRQLLFDLYTGYFYSQIGLAEQVPAWLVIDDKEATSEVRIPAKELVVCAKCFIAMKKYDQALAVLSNSHTRAPHERFLLSELVFSLMLAVARIMTDDIQGAMESLKKAYALSFDGVFEMPFVELGKNMPPLVAEALNQGLADIPAEWLKAIGRKASIYAKKAEVVMASFKGLDKAREAVQLSEREKEVLHDMYHGLSRDEIAINRFLSVNTVKKTLQSIYFKLDANNNVDAIRIAIEKKLIQ